MFRRGFTLIELLVVISIVALLASVVLASLNNARDRGRLGAAKYFATQVDHIAGDQMIGAWDFEECSGNTVSDRSGSNDAGTFSGGNGWSVTDTPSGTGCSGSFTGSNFLTTPLVTTEAVGNNAFTVSFWMKQAAGQNRASMVSNSNYIVGGWMVAEGYTATNARLFFERNYIGSNNTIEAPTDMPLDRWVHVAATYDGISSIALYQDGVRVASGAASASAGSAFTVRIGSTQQGGWGQYTGLLDSVHLFSKGLSASEVGKIYAEEKSRFQGFAQK